MILLSYLDVQVWPEDVFYNLALYQPLGQLSALAFSVHQGLVVTTLIVQCDLVLNNK